MNAKSTRFRSFRLFYVSLLYPFLRFSMPCRVLLTSAKLAAMILLTFNLGLLTSPDAQAQAIKVEIVEKDGKFQLLRDGQPYQVKGVGMTGIDFELASKYGANSIRTWSVDDNKIPALELLDKAHELGMTVSLCLEFARERQGFDYNNEELVAKQLAKSRERVLRYKDHPALLTWIIGNEVNFDFTNPKVFDAINDVAEMIKEIDPNHPTTTALAGYDRKALNEIDKRAPALDFVSFQMYADLANLPKYIKQDNYTKPYFVTEWGAVGHWEVYETPWGAPVENTSTQKAEHYLKSYDKVLAAHGDQAIGNYVFLWGQKQEKTPTWYGMFLASGEETETIDVMQYIWSGAWPEHKTPKVSTININQLTAFDNVTLQTNEVFSASIAIDALHIDSLDIRWEVRKESTSKAVGGDAEYIPPVIDDLFIDTLARAKDSDRHSVSFSAPPKKGAYRLFAYVYDDHGNAAHANIPFYVN